MGLGFDVDVHVEMTVNAAQNVTSQIVVNGSQAVALPVRPGDALTATLCLNSDNPATATAFCGWRTRRRHKLSTSTSVVRAFPPRHQRGDWARIPVTSGS